MSTHRAKLHASKVAEQQFMKEYLKQLDKDFGNKHLPNKLIKLHSEHFF